VSLGKWSENWSCYRRKYSQSHLGCHFRKLKAQRSNVSFATFQWKETFDLWALSFETAFKNVTPSGISCTSVHLQHITAHSNTLVHYCHEWDLSRGNGDHEKHGRTCKGWLRPCNLGCFILPGLAEAEFASQGGSTQHIDSQQSAPRKPHFNEH